jgi:flavin reductase (DIM6/NTAB) family NADH-FMN oxidoreductase RutF
LKGCKGDLVETWLVLGEVIGVHIDARRLKDGVFDTFGAGIVLRSGGASAYVEIRRESRFDMVRPA